MTRPIKRGAQSKRFRQLWADPERAERMLAGTKKATKALSEMSEFDKLVRIWRRANVPRVPKKSR